MTELYSVFVGGGEVNDELLDLDNAHDLAMNYVNEGYEDVSVFRVCNIGNDLEKHK